MGLVLRECVDVVGEHDPKAARPSIFTELREDRPLDQLLAVERLIVDVLWHDGVAQLSSFGFEGRALRLETGPPFTVALHRRADTAVECSDPGQRRRLIARSASRF